MERRIAVLASDRGGWSVAWNEDSVEVLRPVAVEVRAVDEGLRRHRSRETLSDPNRAWRSKVVNRGLVLDGFGRRLTTFLETQAYQNTEFGAEQIEEWTTVTVLVLEDRPAGVGVCKDFCTSTITKYG